METIEKLKILSADSQYDLACACGTLKDEHRTRGQEGKWLYPVVLPNGGRTVLLKTLLSNVCSNDCRYCPLRAGSDSPRCSLSPEEVANVFLSYVRRKKVFGLFLSSGVIGTPDRTMERLNTAARLLREKHAFRGYIHLKIIPGASDAAVEEAVSLATAVSLNIETPSQARFEKLTQKKEYGRDILRPLGLMSRLTAKGSRYSRVKCTTQYIVGASDETDREIVSSMFDLYKSLRFQRVYFSAYQQGLGRPDIPGEQRRLLRPDEPFVREHRLYQADFLIRKYGFGQEDFLYSGSENLSLDRDPKQVWADSHPAFYPVRINRADREMLLRVPGIGPETAARIVKQRMQRKIREPEDVGVKGKRAATIRRYAVFE